MNDRTKRATRAGLLLVLLCLGTCAILRTRATAPLPAPPPPVPPLAAATTAPAANEPPAARSAPSASPPIIDSITLEKEEVCEGEENLVTVRAHTPDGNDAFLHYQVGSASGSAIPVRSYLDDRGRPSANRVSVFGKNNVVTTAEVPKFRVKQCEAGLAIVIEHRLLPNTVAEFDFDARVVNMGPRVADGGATAAFRPQKFAWAFGDGERAEGREPHTTHSFAARAQDTLYSPFLITVNVLGEDGRALKGRLSIELLNPAFEAFAYKGVALVFADLNPRFPVVSPSGVIDQGVRLWHTRPDAVAITKIAVTTRYGNSTERALPTYPPVSSVLGATEILPGPGLEVHVSLDTHLEPDVVGRDYHLEGRTRDGHLVRGAFSVMKPPAPPSKERHDPISDPVLLAKVKKARALLHRDFVTDEDIWALERAGQFAGLRADAASAEPAPQPQQ